MKRLEKLRCKWEDNIKMNRKEVRWEDVDWVKLARNRAQWQLLRIR
jgi:hypothetical protein